MLDVNAEKFLLRQFEKGAVNLFLGAGFSVEATNLLGQSPPLGVKLSEELADAAGFTLENDVLPQVFAAARRTMGGAELEAFLKLRYKVRTWADWYRSLPDFVWNRIYTTNIDDLVEKIYASRQCQQVLDRHVCPTPFRNNLDAPKTLQLIKLHGDIDTLQNGVRFTLQEFAELQSQGVDDWYSQLVDDIFSISTIFIGTFLEESPLHHYIALRGAKDRGVTDYRVKSYLVSPNISHVRKLSLADQNVIAVEATGKDFFAYLESRLGIRRPTVATVRSNRMPVVLGTRNKEIARSIERGFTFVTREFAETSERAVRDQFYLGTEPTWKDILEGRDAAREITGDIERQLVDEDSKFILLYGPPGSGKTTILKRLALDAAIAGHRVFWATHESRVELSALVQCENVPLEREAKSIVFVDVVSRSVQAVTSAIRHIAGTKGIYVVAADRTYNVSKHEGAFSLANAYTHHLQDLTEGEITNILARLEHFRFLGKLAEMQHVNRVNIWKSKASRQLLVAMKETTQGRGFDEIIEDEYKELPQESKLAYVICCIAVAQGAIGVYRKHLLSAFGKATFSKGKIVADLLHGVLVPVNEAGTLLAPRHRIIAQHVSKNAANARERRQAIVSFLTAVAGEVCRTSARDNTPTYRAYVGMVNSSHLLDSFSGNYPEVISLYDELSPLYGQQPLFWLHYGRTHGRLGRLDLANVYLQQAKAASESTGRRHHYQIQHQLGILNMMQAVQTRNYVSGVIFATEGMTILEDLVAERGDKDAYPYAAYLEYTAQWYLIARKEITEREWEDLLERAAAARRTFRVDSRIATAAKRVEDAYLLRIVPEEQVDAAVTEFLAKSRLQ